MNNMQKALIVAAAALTAWALWPRRSSAAGAPAGSLANDPHTQSLLLQDIHTARYIGGTSSQPLVIDITKDCRDMGTC